MSNRSKKADNFGPDVRFFFEGLSTLSLIFVNVMKFPAVLTFVAVFQLGRKAS